MASALELELTRKLQGCLGVMPAVEGVPEERDCLDAYLWIQKDIKTVRFMAALISFWRNQGFVFQKRTGKTGVMLFREGDRYAAFIVTITHDTVAGTVRITTVPFAD